MLRKDLHCTPSSSSALAFWATLSFRSCPPSRDLAHLVVSCSTDQLHLSEAGPLGSRLCLGPQFLHGTFCLSAHGIGRTEIESETL